MKLETKHILPYLGYELRAEILDYKSNYVGRRYDEIIGIHQWSINKDWCLLTDGGSKPSLNSVKLILRPMSEVKEYFEDIFESDKEVNEFLSYESTSPFSVDELPDYKFEYLPYGTCQVLLKHKFDIFNLTPNGLAISIHDVKQ